MRKQVLIIISVALASFLVGTMFSTNYLAMGGGKPNPIWEAIYDLQVKVNSLANTVTEQQAQISELQNTVDSIEEKLKETTAKTIRFYDPLEYATESPYPDWTVGSSFQWTPENSTNNAILAVHCYFQFRVQHFSTTRFKIAINNVTQQDKVGFPYGYYDMADYEWSPVYAYTLPTQWREGVGFGGKPLVPNQNSYVLEFRFQVDSGYSAYVKNINIIIAVVDGLPANG